MAEQVTMNALTKIFLASGIAFLAVVCLVYGSGVLIPVAVALLLWFLINAVAKGFQWFSIGGWRMPRLLALTLSLATIFAASFYVVELVVLNLTAMSSGSIDFQNSLDPLIDKISDLLGVKNKDILNQMADHIGLETLFSRIVAAMASFASNLGVVFVYVLFLMIEQSFFDAKIAALIRDDERRRKVKAILARMGRDIQTYMLLMTFVSALTGGLSYLVMTWMGLQHAAFWAFLVFVLNYIPTIGSIIGTILPALFAFIQFQAFGPFLALLGLLSVIQFSIGNILQPRLAGQSLNLSQFVVILALFVWGAIWGITGMFLAVPITAIMMIVFSNVEATQPIAILLSEQGKLDPVTHPPED